MINESYGVEPLVGRVLQSSVVEVVAVDVEVGTDRGSHSSAPFLVGLMLSQQNIVLQKKARAASGEAALRPSAEALRSDVSAKYAWLTKNVKTRCVEFFASVMRVSENGCLSKPSS